MRRFPISTLHRAMFNGPGRLMAGAGMLCLSLAVFPANCLAQERMYASPEFEGGSEFSPSEFEQVELPVALGGFCPVSLRNKHQWVEGLQRQMLVYDGQIYWFASARKRGIFAASPTSYAPVLGGDCAVTLAESGERILGKLEFAIEHAGRLYMFASKQHREQFQSNPDAYDRADLANDGYCLVSQIDSDKRVAGMPETTVMVDGMRYMFAGDYQRRKFAVNLHRYGVKRHLLVRPAEDTPVHRARPAKSEADTTEKAKPLDGETESEVTDADFAMDGYCPVTIHQRNIWVRGSFQYQAEFQGKLYLLAGEAEKKRFEMSPEEFAPAIGGECVVSKVDDGQEVPGSIYHAVFDPESKRMFLFAGADQKTAFNKSPQRYMNLIKAAKRGASEGDTSADEGAPQATPTQDVRQQDQ